MLEPERHASVVHFQQGLCHRADFDRPKLLKDDIESYLGPNGTALSCLERRFEASLASCMKAEGFTYVPRTPKLSPIEPPVTDRVESRHGNWNAGRLACIGQAQLVLAGPDIEWDSQDVRAWTLNRIGKHVPFRWVGGSTGSTVRFLVRPQQRRLLTGQ